MMLLIRYVCIGGKGKVLCIMIISRVTIYTSAQSVMKYDTLLISNNPILYHTIRYAYDAIRRYD